MINPQDLIQALLDAAINVDQTNSYTFWSTQPVPKFDEAITTNECIKSNVEIIQEAKAEPYTLPDGFKWDTLDLNNSTDLVELYALLNENYIEDKDSLFRFDYQLDFLKWSLQPPGWKREWHIGVRVVKSGRLVGFISAIPSTLRAHDEILRVVEVNFLCVHKKLRNKRVAPVLIRELIRVVSLNRIFQAVYTTGVILPKPVAVCRYYHRPINPKKLIEVHKFKKNFFLNSLNLFQ